MTFIFLSECSCLGNILGHFSICLNGMHVYLFSQVLYTTVVVFNIYLVYDDQSNLNVCCYLQSIQTILEKFKEKKATVVAALREAIDACFMAVS